MAVSGVALGYRSAGSQIKPQDPKIVPHIYITLAKRMTRDTKIYAHVSVTDVAGVGLLGDFETFNQPEVSLPLVQALTCV